MRQIPLEDNSMDCALSTWTICTIPDMAKALAELRRVLKPGGRLHFLEHGHAPDNGVARLQCFLKSIQKLYAGGCRLNVRMGELIREAGFDIVELSNFYMPGRSTPRTCTRASRSILRATASRLERVAESWNGVGAEAEPAMTLCVTARSPEAIAVDPKGWIRDRVCGPVCADAVRASVAHRRRQDAAVLEWRGGAVSVSAFDDKAIPPKPVKKRRWRATWAPIYR